MAPLCIYTVQYHVMIYHSILLAFTAKAVWLRRVVGLFRFVDWWFLCFPFSLLYTHISLYISVSLFALQFLLSAILGDDSIALESSVNSKRFIMVSAQMIWFFVILFPTLSLSLSAQSSLCSIFPSNSFNEREMIIHSYSISISTDTNTHILQLWPLYCLIAHVSCILDNEYDEWIWPAWWKASKRFIVSIKSNVLRNAKQNGRAGHHKADLRFSMKQSSCGHNRRAICYI